MVIAAEEAEQPGNTVQSTPIIIHLTQQAEKKSADLSNVSSSAITNHFFVNVPSVDMAPA